MRIIKRKGNMFLVQWEDENLVPQRNWVKESAVHGEGKDLVVDYPEQGVPYAFDFGHVVDAEITPDDINRELRKRGIWTLLDLRANPKGALGALMSATGVVMSQLLEAANEYEKLLKSK